MINLKKKIGVITGTRAEYGILEPLIKKISESKELELQLYVTAMHLSEFYGHTIDEIKYPITAKIDMKIKEKNTKQDMTDSTAVGIKGFSESFSKHNPDVVVVLGDRIEQFAAAYAAMVLGISIAHIHGGDVSGGIDNYLRNMVTKMASIHFPASELSAKRVKAFGEEEWRIHVVGAPGLDSLLSRKITSKADLAKKYNLNPEKDWALTIYHPDTTSTKSAGTEMKIILKSLERTDTQKIIIYPNSDASSGLIINEIDKFVDEPDFSVFRSIEHNDFIGVMAGSAFMIGNSSSALIEAPSLGVPAINIGSRQNQREHGKSVIDIPHPSEADVIVAIDKVTKDDKFISEVKKCISPYGDGKSSVRIVKLLEKLKIDERLLKK